MCTLLALAASDPTTASAEVGLLAPGAKPPPALSPGFAAVAPLRSALTLLTPFQPPAHRYGPGHRGVDLAAPPGIPVFAAADGTVIYAGMVAGRGVVSIQHSATLRTTYEPVAATVTAGQVIRAGDRIGVIDGAHHACAPASCLHWGARLARDHYIDPMTLLGTPVIRLKPWRSAT